MSLSVADVSASTWPPASDAAGDYTWTADYRGSSTADMDINSTNSTATPTEGAFDFNKFLLIYLSVIFVLIVIGNTCVLVAIMMSKQGHRSRMNFFIMHLAIADLSNAFGVVLVELIWKVVITWHAHNSVCKLIKYIQGVVTYGSTFVLVSLSIDRLDAIARPMSFTGSGLRAKILIVSAWVFSLLFAIPMLVFNNVTNIKGTDQCWLQIPDWKLYLTMVASACFFIPTLIITVCYVIIIGIIWDKSHGLSAGDKKSSRQSNAGSASEPRRHNSTGESKSSSRGVIPQAKVRTIKMTLVIVLAFVVCWCPFFVMNLLMVYQVVDRRSIPNSFNVFIQMLTSLNSFANPLIYGIFSTRICRHLRKFRMCNWIMDKTCCCCPSLQLPMRQQSIYTSNSTTYTAIDGSMRKRSLPRGRRQSGPPVVRGVLTEKENQILLRTLDSEKRLAEFSTVE